MCLPYYKPSNKVCLLLTQRLYHLIRDTIAYQNAVIMGNSHFFICYWYNELYRHRKGYTLLAIGIYILSQKYRDTPVQ